MEVILYFTSNIVQFFFSNLHICIINCIKGNKFIVLMYLVVGKVGNKFEKIKIKLNSYFRLKIVDVYLHEFFLCRTQHVRLTSMINSILHYWTHVHRFIAIMDYHSKYFWWFDYKIIWSIFHTHIEILAIYFQFKVK